MVKLIYVNSCKAAEKYYLRTLHNFQHCTLQTGRARLIEFRHADRNGLSNNTLSSRVPENVVFNKVFPFPASRKKKNLSSSSTQIQADHAGKKTTNLLVIFSQSHVLSA